MDLTAAIKLTTDWAREEYENPQFSAIENVLELREELADQAGAICLGDDDENAAFELVLAATRADLAAALIALASNSNSGY
jgi:hypothetical protein